MLGCPLLRAEKTQGTGTLGIKNAKTKNPSSKAALPGLALFYFPISLFIANMNWQNRFFICLSF